MLAKCVRYNLGGKIARKLIGRKKNVFDLVEGVGVRGGEV